MSRDAATSTGITVAGLGSRALVNILDLAPLALLSSLVLASQNLPTSTLVEIPASVLGLAWLVGLWRAYATRGQGPAATWLRVRFLRLADGQPPGWGRWFLRTLVWYGSMIVPIVWLVLVVQMMLHPRRRGWHDLAGQSVVVHATGLAAPSAQLDPARRPSAASANVVPLPANLKAQAAHVPAETDRQDSSAPHGFAPITALPDFAASMPKGLPSSQVPTPAPASDEPGDQWGAPSPIRQHVYVSQLPYNAPDAYLPEPPNPYALAPSEATDACRSEVPGPS
jgi:uncharacterized RDD family membrane protein YckC